ncbi:MAG: phosphoheptose isomerase [Rhodospirillaceae bacterium]|nr:phosphoheptose isomerase [Rhodospirillaceae bacterium]|tara:strand:- start:6950 stop:7540 length:591 start_codon:yes stop_codon:yes gene_type:complete
MKNRLDLSQLYNTVFEEHQDVLKKTRNECYADIMAMHLCWLSAIRSGRKILFFGNGGSASDCQHLATELTVRFRKNRSPISAVALTTDSSALTAIGNDMGFENLFSRQLEAIGELGDIAVGISTSGKSANVIKGLEIARKKGMKPVGFTGCGGGEIRELANPLIVVPSYSTARIQEMHILIGQCLCEALEIDLGLV